MAATAVFDALSDPTRRAIVVELARAPRSAGEVGALFPISQPAVSRHLRILRESGLVEDVRSADDARVRLYRLRSEPLQELDGWLSHLRRMWQAQLGAYREFVERQP
jgi:DNA-binding transcriptional ArsR family regulator